jgi:[ribosomal protein S5]-alanine N-acetyltransferase
MILRTDRLVFRPHEAGDEGAFVAMHTDPEVRRYVGGRPWSLDEAQSRFRRGYLGRENGGFGLWATILEEEGTYVGMCGLIGNEADSHLGYYLARPYWGRRLASEAASAFVDLGFNELRLHRIRADVDQKNAASIRILEKLEFQLVEHEALESGRVISHYEILRLPPS